MTYFVHFEGKWELFYMTISDFDPHEILRALKYLGIKRQTRIILDCLLDQHFVSFHNPQSIFVYLFRIFSYVTYLITRQEMRFLALNYSHRINDKRYD